jgi:DNA-binding transcriptional LysR family regulator
VAAFPTAVMGLLPAAVRRLRRDAPQLRVEILELEPDDARLALRAGSCDLALVNHHSLLAPDGRGPWQVVHIRDERVRVAVSLDHPLAGRSQVAIAGLETEAWVMQQPASPCQELAQRLCAAGGFAPQVVATCGDYRSILALVAADVGVSIVPELALTGLDVSGVALIETRPRTQRRINALLSSRTDAAPAARAFLNALLEEERR